MKKIKEYKPKDKSNILYKNTLYENICQIKKPYVQHWIFSQIPSIFITENLSLWDIHPNNIIQIDILQNNYTILAESDRGPEVT